MERAVLHLFYMNGKEGQINLNNVIGLYHTSENTLIVSTLISGLEFENVKSFYLIKS